ncbi:MAG: DUF1501 domain-containing protein [Myxococcota bacterium]
MPTMSRRLLMKTMVTGLAGLTAGAGPTALAAAGRSRRVIFVFANGGWDPLAVFAPIFGSPYVDANDGERATSGGLSYVDHPERPSVRAFFERWHASTAIVNGISVPSLSHEVCTRLVWTGQSGEGRPDWPSTVGAAAAGRYTLPGLVLSGPSFPDRYGVYSARAGANGQLADLIDGSILYVRDVADTPLPVPLRGLVSDAVEARAAAFAATDPSADAVADAYTLALDRARGLTDAPDPLDLRSAIDFASSTALAVDALDRGISRAVTLEADGVWDSHSANDATQSFQFEGLFAGLLALLDQLAATPSGAGTLLDDTAVVVLSEMGRTPLRNSAEGRDHWPYTSAMLVGGGVRGDQVVSGFDDRYFPLGYDAATGATAAGGEPLATEHLGATLLALCDIDPAEHLPTEISPIAAVLA